MKIKVVVVEDQYMAQKLFELYLKNSDKYEIIRTVSSAATAGDVVSSVPADLVLMDILMNDSSNGLDAAAEIKKIRPKIKL